VEKIRKEKEEGKLQNMGKSKRSKENKHYLTKMKKEGEGKLKKMGKNKIGLKKLPVIIHVASKSDDFPTRKSSTNLNHPYFLGRVTKSEICLHRDTQCVINRQ